MNEKLVIQISADSKQAVDAFERLEREFRETTSESKRLSASFADVESAYTKSSNALRRESLGYRKQVTELNSELASNRVAMAHADAAGQKLLDTRNKQIRIEQGLARAHQQTASTTLASLTQQRRELKGLGDGYENATKKSGGFIAGLGSMKGALAGLGIGLAVQQTAHYADAAFRLGDRLKGVHRGLETVYGSATLATQRFEELNELAKLPGLDPGPLAKFDAIYANLNKTGKATQEVWKANDTIFTGLAKTITTFGGDVFAVNSALLQLSQGFGKNTIDAQDWKSINEQTGGSVMKVAQEVLGFTGGINGMRTAFQASGKTLQDFLMPVFEQLNAQFEGAPVGSYTNKIDNLGVAFNNLVATVADGSGLIGRMIGTLTDDIEKLTEHFKGSETVSAGGFERFNRELGYVSASLSEVSAELNTAQARYDDYIKDGVNPAAASMQQLKRQIDALTPIYEGLKDRVRLAKNEIAKILKPTENLSTVFRVLTQDIEKVDTRFLTFHERGQALKDEIPPLSAEITGLVEGFGWLYQKASAISPVFEDIQKVAERGLFDVVQKDIADTQKALEGLHDTAISSRLAMASFTDISGATPPIEDFMQSDAYRYGAVDIDTGGRRSHLQSPLSGFSPSGSIADLGITPAVLAFNEKVDISSDVLDQFNAQTKYTAEELEELRGKELADFGGSLSNIVQAIDNLGPVFEDLGINITSQRSHGNLALNTAAGTGQVLSGDVYGGLTNIIKSMWEWGQPDREALAQQHQDALQRERERVQKIQSELDFYDTEREQLFQKRLDFLNSAESTFNDWIDTLQSFSDHDLARGQQVFSEFSAAMNAYNDAVNQARLELEPTDASKRYNLYQSLKEKGVGALETTPAQAEATAREMYGGAAYDAEVEAAKKMKDLWELQTNAADIQAKAIAENKKRGEELLVSSRAFVADILGIYTNFQEALDAQRTSLPSTQYVPGRSAAEAAAADHAFLQSLRPRSPGEVTTYDRQVQALEQQVSGSIERIFQSILGDRMNTLFPVGGVDGLKAIGIQGVENYSPERLVNEITARLPSAIEKIESGTLTGMMDASYQRLANTMLQLSQEEQQGFELVKTGMEQIDATFTTQTDLLNTSVQDIPAQLSPLVKTGMEQIDATFTTQTDLLNTSVQDIPAQLSPLLENIARQIEAVVGGIGTLANQPVSVHVNMNTGGQVVELLSKEIAKKTKQNTVFN